MFHLKRLIPLTWIIIWLLAGPSLTALAQGEDEKRDPVFEQEILDRLEAISPEAVPLFQKATQDLDTGNYETAVAGFTEVLSLAPDFPDALRRLSYCELMLEFNQQALEHARLAYEIDPSPYNQISLAQVLVMIGSPAYETEALKLAKDAITRLPDDADAYSVLMIAAFAREENETLRTACETLFRLAPDEPLPHIYYGILAADEGKWEKAEAELLLSQELGWPSEDIQQILEESGISAQARIYRSLRWGGYTVAGWLAGMVLLLLMGMLLSGITMAAVKREQTNPHPEPSTGEKLVRSIYRAIIGLTSVYFYISMPFLILVVVAATAAVFYMFFAIGHIPIRLAVIIGLAAIYTLYVIVRSVFMRVKEVDPGRPLKQEEAPALWRLTDEVANKLATRPIQAIFITPGVEVAVTEQGGFWRKIMGKGRRSLILGLGGLNEMTQGQFKSVLAHEYGHFTGKDTAGGDLAQQVQISVHSMAYGLATSGVANWFNPAWLFINGFYRIFIRITRGASRLQEILADRYAAIAYGANNFVEGLKHIIRQSIKFNAQVNYEVNQAIESHSRLQNLYTLPNPPLEDLEQKLSTDVEEAMNRQTSVYDTHPSPNERFQLIQRLNLPERLVSYDDGSPVWDLMPNAAALQDEMTSQVQRNVDAQVTLRQEAEPEDEAPTS